jgi:3-methyladenine DNA glycosylase Mpg
MRTLLMLLTSKEVQELIIRMATENRWRARKIQAELMKLGIRSSLATVSRYVPKTKPDATQQQRWTTFLRGPAKLAKRLRLRRPRNHKDVIAGMDFFTIDITGAKQPDLRIPRL